MDIALYRHPRRYRLTSSRATMPTNSHTGEDYTVTSSGVNDQVSPEILVTS